MTRMEEQIEGLPAQFSWEPELVRGDALPSGIPVVCGMGGSHLGVQLLSVDAYCPPLFIHSDYGLPNLPEEVLARAVIIASSYSGETEETIDAAKAAHEKGLPLIVIASGGTLAKFADEIGAPLVLLPKADIEPRMAIGYSMRAFARVLGSDALSHAVEDAANSLSLPDAKHIGTGIAKALAGRVPVFYSSSRMLPAAYHLKANLNETGKLPAFYNVVPEANHNEFTGYAQDANAVMPVFLKDPEDDARVAARMDVMKEMLSEIGVESRVIELPGESPLSRAVAAVAIGGYAGMALAALRHMPDAETPRIAEFKKRLAKRHAHPA